MVSVVRFLLHAANNLSTVPKKPILFGDCIEKQGPNEHPAASTIMSVVDSLVRAAASQVDISGERSGHPAIVLERCTPLGDDTDYQKEPTPFGDDTDPAAVPNKPTNLGNITTIVGPDSFETQYVIGSGSFAVVHKAKHKEDGRVYAMKILPKKKLRTGNLMRYAFTERNILTYISHPYIVSLHYAFQTSTQLVLVLNYCQHGDLQQAIHRCKRFPEELARFYSAEILLALAYLHERDIVFRDLKPGNVLLDSCGHGLLTDFGLAKEGVRGLRGTNSFCGSVAFLAPEVLERKRHGHTVDIYGLGVFLFHMLTGHPPFYNRNMAVLHHNVKHATLQIPKYASHTAASLIQALMNRVPEQRLGAGRTSDVQNDPFFASVDFVALMRREVPVPAQAVTTLMSTSLNSQGLLRNAPFEANYTCDAHAVHGWDFMRNK